MHEALQLRMVVSGVDTDYLYIAHACICPHLSIPLLKQPKYWAADIEYQMVQNSYMELWSLDTLVVL